MESSDLASFETYSWLRGVIPLFSGSTPPQKISIKIVAHIFAAKAFICINAAETSNTIIATETVTERSTKKQ